MHLMPNALSGLRILDFSWAGAGPFGTKFLADFGAQVIKIESRKRLDVGRVMAPFARGRAHHDEAGLFLHTNTSKLSITLNLSLPEGIEIAKKLVAISDVVVQNFRPGVMKKLGLDYENLILIKPDIIMASLSIYGQTGPKSSFAGWGNAGNALSGHYMLTGWPDREPVYPNLAFADVVQPIFTVIGILSALDYRRRTGRGQHIDVTQVETMIQFISPAILEYYMNNHKPMRMGNRSSYACPHGIFPCKGTDKWCAIAIFNDEQWRSLCMALGKDKTLDDERFTSFVLRKKHEDELESLISSWTVKYERDDLATILERAKIPSGPVQDMSDLDSDPHISERQSFIKLTHPVIGVCNHPTPPVKLSITPAQVNTAPCLGEHNEYVYKQLLGMTEEEYATLLEKGVFE